MIFASKNQMFWYKIVLLPCSLRMTDCHKASSILALKREDAIFNNKLKKIKCSDLRLFYFRVHWERNIVIKRHKFSLWNVKMRYLIHFNKLKKIKCSDLRLFYFRVHWGRNITINCHQFKDSSWIEKMRYLLTIKIKVYD